VNGFRGILTAKSIDDAINRTRACYKGILKIKEVHHGFFVLCKDNPNHGEWLEFDGKYRKVEDKPCRKI
jgi:hypothetical protein